MYIYTVNPDGITCAVQAHRDGEIPEGWAELPFPWSGQPVYWDGEGPTLEKPLALIALEEAAALENTSFKDQLIALVQSTSFADLETKVETIFSNCTAAQRMFLLQVSRVVLYLAKRAI